MKIRAAIIGYGAVAEIHARRLSMLPGVEAALVCGPDRARGEDFARRHNIARAVDDLNELAELVDAAIIASPSAAHFEQAAFCLTTGLHTLVELPPCETVDEAEWLGQLADECNLVLACAQTSRYLEPYTRIAGLLADGALGMIRQISYTRHLAPRRRSWTDDAILHHAAHPLDLWLAWFGDLQAAGCLATPEARLAQEAALMMQLPGGAPATISISYRARLPQSRMLIVGEEHTIETDGFSYLWSDVPEWGMDCDPGEAYESAIGAQDGAFLAACRGGGKTIGWGETMTLIRRIGEFRELEERTRNTRNSRNGY